ncbi:MAG: membrane protein insertion efficiency factor YidD [Vicinamibacterales bacterium]
MWWSSRAARCSKAGFQFLKPISNPPSSAASAAFPDAVRSRPGAVACLVLGLLKGYKRAVSPLFGNICRFLPTCSEYMAEAVSRHGALTGVLLGVARLGRCHPLCRGGHDPVPDRLPAWLAGPRRDQLNARPR